MKLTEPVSIVSFWISFPFFSFNSLGVISTVAGFDASYWVLSLAIFNRSPMMSTEGVIGDLGSKKKKMGFYWHLVGVIPFSILFKPPRFCQNMHNYTNHEEHKK